MWVPLREADACQSYIYGVASPAAMVKDVMHVEVQQSEYIGCSLLSCIERNTKIV